MNEREPKKRQAVGNKKKPEMIRKSGRPPKEEQDGVLTRIAELENEILSEVSDLTQEEEELLQAEIVKAAESSIKEELEILESEYQKERLVLKDLKERGADKTEIDTQDKLCKALYDKKYKLRVTPALTLPKQLYSLLDTKECTIIQKKWLMFYCANRGNWVDACVKAKVKVSTYRGWIDVKMKSLSNVKFREAQKDVKDAFTEIGEAKLKEMVASKNSAAVIFYMKNQHEDYKPTVKMIEETKQKKEKGLASLAGVSTDKQVKMFQRMMNKVKSDRDDNETFIA